MALKCFSIQILNFPICNGVSNEGDIYHRASILKLKLLCILYFELSRNQRQGPESFLGKWISRGGLSLPSSPIVTGAAFKLITPMI